MKFVLTFLLFCAPLLRAQDCAHVPTMIIASRLHSPLDSNGLPTSTAWQSAKPIAFCADWQGNHPDPQRETTVRLLWSPDALYLQFRASYRTLYTFPGGPMRRDQLWTRDVAETFLQPDHQSGRNYAELEISPNGDWIDLAITDGKLSNLQCALKSNVLVHESEKLWTADLAVPMSCLTKSFDPKRPWRANFFRIEAPEPNRFYSSWQPTNTPNPNFHVPEVFRTLKFEE